MADQEKNNPHDNAAPMPTDAEIIQLIKAGKGTTHVWQTLGQKYGSPKGTYGKRVYSLIIANNADRAKDNQPQDNATNNPSNPNAAVAAKTSTNSVSCSDKLGYSCASSRSGPCAGSCAVFVWGLGG